MKRRAWAEQRMKKGASDDAPSEANQATARDAAQDSQSRNSVQPWVQAVSCPLKAPA